MTDTITHLLQEAFRDTVRRQNDIHTLLNDGDIGDTNALNRLWQAVDTYQHNLTDIIRTYVNSPEEKQAG